MFSLYKKELQSYFLSPIAYFVIAFFMATFSLTFIQEIGNVSSSTYTFSFSSIFYVNIFYFIFLLPLLTMRTFSEERKNGTETLILNDLLTELQSSDPESYEILMAIADGLSERAGAERLQMPRNTFVYKRNQLLKRLKEKF